MTAQQLKASILQLAIQGKLVPQNPVDEPASVLLRRIKAEKDALVKAGKLKKDKRESVIVRAEDGRYLEKKDGKTTDITDEIPFDIPESWEWVRLGTICQVKGGKRIPLGDKMLDTPTAHIYLRVTDMKDGTIIDAPKKYISEETYLKISKYTISSDDLYLTIAGTIGLVGIIPDEYNGMNLTENAAKLTSIYANRLFLAKLLNAPYFQGIFLYKKTQVAQPKLALERIASVLFPLPPLEEQARIVAKIEELLPHVEEYGKAETELSKLNAELPEQLKKSILQWAIQGRLVPQDPTDEPASELLNRIKAEKAALIKSGKLKKEKPLPPISEDEIPFDIPDSWSWVRLGTISHGIQYGFTASASAVGNARMLRITDIHDNSVSWKDVPFCTVTEEEFQKYQLHNRDILIARTGGTIGKTYIVNELSEKAVFASYLIRIVPALNLSENYLKLFMESPLYWSELKSASAGTGQPNVNGQALRSLFLPLPPLAEQNRIVERLENLFVHLNCSLIHDKGAITHGTE